jgi:hypothetical protein
VVPSSTGAASTFPTPLPAAARLRWSEVGTNAVLTFLKSRNCASAGADASAGTAADGLGGRDDGAACAGVRNPEFCAIGAGPLRGKKPGGGGACCGMVPRVRVCTPLEAAVGRCHRAGLQQCLVAVAEAAEGGPEAVEKRVRLGNLEVVVGQLPCLQGSQVAVAVPVEAAGMVRVLHDRHISGYLAAIGCKAYVRCPEEGPPA